MRKRDLEPAAAPEMRGGIVWLLLALVVLFLPFVGRAFNIDDPLFVWAAKHIQQQPGNPYGFAINWYGASEQMSAVTKNPPLASYYLAAAASLVGWSEIAVHLVFLLPALAVAYGAYLLARGWCQRPLVAAAASVLTPVFFVSGLTVMSDMLMLAFWVFAVYFWIKGLETKSHLALATAAVLIALASLTKYFGIALIPLLVVYAAMRERRAGPWLGYLLIPLAVLTWYHVTTDRLYGHGLLFDAAEYATNTEVGFKRFTLAKTTANFAFLGGCIASVLFFSRRLWSGTALVGGLVSAVAVTAVIASFDTLGTFTLPTDAGARWLLAAQMGLWVIAGLSILTLAIVDLRRRRDADSVLLFLWVIGTFVFAGFINWTVNGRSILPIIVPAGILVARRLDAQPKIKRPGGIRLPWAPLIAAAALSLAVAWADTGFANAARTGASTIYQEVSGGHTVWFQGHWGFQYYMEAFGGKPMDVEHWSLNARRGATPWSLAPGDVVVIPGTNTNFYPIPKDWTVFRKFVDLPASTWIATLNKAIGAGFHSDDAGPLPFAVGAVGPERFIILDVPLPRTPGDVPRSR